MEVKKLVLGYPLFSLLLNQTLYGSRFRESRSCWSVFDNFVRTNIVLQSVIVVTNGWIKTQFSFFSLVSGRLWLSLFRWRWGQTGLWPTLSDPICQVHVWSLFVPQVYQWHHLHAAEYGKWVSGAAHLEIIMQRFTHGCRPEREFVYFLIW